MLKDEYAVKRLCATLQVSRSGYYAWCGQAPRRRAKTEAFADEVARIHHESGGTYGSPRVTRVLQRSGRKVGHNRVARALRERGLQGRARRRYRVRTTDSAHDHPIAPNHLTTLAPPTRPDQVWVSDITYIETKEGWLYLAAVLDLYSRRIVGWAMDDSLAATLPLAALHMALAWRQPARGLVHHSDRGVQYASSDYRAVLAAHAVTASMSRKGNCYDNATMEAFWSTLKHELVYRSCFLTRAEAKTALFDYIERFYNRVRLHSSLDYLSPLQFESRHSLPPITA
jgi:transposase InsO family protein